MPMIHRHLLMTHPMSSASGRIEVVTQEMPRTNLGNLSSVRLEVREVCPPLNLAGQEVMTHFPSEAQRFSQKINFMSSEVWVSPLISLVEYWGILPPIQIQDVLIIFFKTGELTFIVINTRPLFSKTELV